MTNLLRLPSTDHILRERSKTHGDFRETARIAQELKDVMRRSPNWDSLSPVQRECLEMDATKTARILSGDPDCEDHWVDREGYRKLSEGLG